MTYTVYIDVVFLVNAVMDFVVLAILNKILDSGAGWGRLLSGAAVGGLWACLVSVLPGMPAWVRVAGTYLGVSSLMAIVSFRPAGVKALARAVLGMYLVTAWPGCLWRQEERRGLTDLRAWEKICYKGG